MPRAFTTVEKQTIHDRLMETGRACFLRYGLKKTTIEDLTKPAGIAKASFYLFFHSKEDLYVELFLREMPAMIDRLLDASFRSTTNAREALIRLMKAIVHEIEANEMSRILLDDPSQIERLAASMDFNAILQRAAASYAPIVDAIAAAQTRGEIIEGDPSQLVYSLGLVKLLPITRDRIPAELYESLLDLAPQIIADGLTCPAKKGVA